MTDKSSAWRKRIGAMLREIRTSKGMTQDEVASLTGIKRQNISRIEKGLYDTKIDTIGTICDALDVQIDLVSSINIIPHDTRYKLSNIGDDYTILDTQSHISITFKYKKFNDTLQVSLPDSIIDSLYISRMTREIVDYVIDYHSDIVFDLTPQQWRTWIGAKIKRLRAEQNLTQEELASKCGCTKQNIYKIESGRHSVDIDAIAGVASALGKRIDFV